MRILIVEDDIALAASSQGSGGGHYAVDAAAEGETRPLDGAGIDYDLLILDLNLPGIDGSGYLKSLRNGSPVCR